MFIPSSGGMTGRGGPARMVPPTPQTQPVQNSRMVQGRAPLQRQMVQAQGLRRPQMRMR